MSTKEKNEIVPDDPTQASREAILIFPANSASSKSQEVGFIHFSYQVTETKVFGELTCVFFDIF